MTDFVKRFIIFVETSKKTAANAQAVAWGYGERDDLTFDDWRFSASGQEPATHLGCNTQATDEIANKIEGALSQVPFYKVYDLSDGWTWETALADAGLQVIEGLEVIE
ncbi:MAG TPA: hypothetical protein ENI05_12830 [Porticoccus sp.]|nr:hypothetical protein [Porticoccus sp.]